MRSKLILILAVLFLFFSCTSRTIKSSRSLKADYLPLADLNYKIVGESSAKACRTGPFFLEKFGVQKYKVYSVREMNEWNNHLSLNDEQLSDYAPPPRINNIFESFAYGILPGSFTGTQYGNYNSNSARAKFNSAIELEVLYDAIGKMNGDFMLDPKYVTDIDYFQESFIFPTVCVNVTGLVAVLQDPGGGSRSADIQEPAKKEAKKR